MPDRNIEPDHNAEFLPQGEDNEERELDTTLARQAVPLGRMRYVLAAGVVLVVVLFAIIYFAKP
jgi:hypothetical protein